MNGVLHFPLILVLLVLGACSAQPAPTSKPASGHFYLPPDGSAAVMRQTLVLRDEVRSKRLPVTLLYPDTTGAHPVVVFSHGYGGSGAADRALAEHWARYGYLVVMPTHADSSAFGVPDPAERLSSGLAWQNRAADISFVITSLEEMTRRLEQYPGQADQTRLVVAGHSFGSYTALLTAGLRVDMPEQRGSQQSRTFTDPRPYAFIALSPQGRGGWTGLREGSWDALTRPVLFATGSADLASDRPVFWQLEAYRASPTGDKFQLFIRGADHADLGGREPKEGDRADVAYQAIRSSSLAFLDSYLKARPAAATYLQSSQLEAATNGVAQLRRK